METKKRILISILMFVFTISIVGRFVFNIYIDKITESANLTQSISFEDKLINDIEMYARGDNYEKFEYKINDKVIKYVVPIETYTSDGRNYHGAKILTYERNSIDEPFMLSRTGGISTRKPYQDLLDFVKNNNVFDYTDKELSDMFGSAKLESGYYLGQRIDNIRAGLPAVVWRHWSPNYENLIYLYQTNDPNDLDGYRDRTFIENGENDIAIQDVIPYSYFPVYYQDFALFDPIVFINESEFYFITQTNFDAEKRETDASKLLRSMPYEQREELGNGVFVYNVDTNKYRKIDDLPDSKAKYKYITYKNQFYVYGGDLQNIRKYNDKGEFEKNIEYLSKDQTNVVVNFTGWQAGKTLGDGTAEEYRIANFENIQVFGFTDGMTAVIDLE